MNGDYKLTGKHLRLSANSLKKNCELNSKKHHDWSLECEVIYFLYWMDAYAVSI